jgi:hypothetical protein
LQALPSEELPTAIPSRYSVSVESSLTSAQYAQLPRLDGVMTEILPTTAPVAVSSA